MGNSSYGTQTTKRLGRIGKAVLALIAIAAFGLFVLAAWVAVALVGLHHEVPNAWTIMDLALIGLPVSILAVALAAMFALARSRLVPLWICVGLLALDAVILVSTFE